MLAIFSGIRELALSRYDAIIIKWDIDSNCNINVLDVFTFRNDIIIDTTDKYKITNIGGYNQIIESGWYDYIRTSTLFDSHVPVDVEYIVGWLKANLHDHLIFKLVRPDKETIGIHCRRGDWGRADNNCREVINLEDIQYNHLLLDLAFFEYIKKYEDTTIFISTDSASTLAFFRHQFKDRLFYNKKVEYSYTTTKSPRSMIEAIEDLTSLAACKLIIRDSHSTFSLVASILGCKPLDSWDRPVLIYSGSGL